LIYHPSTVDCLASLWSHPFGMTSESTFTWLAFSEREQQRAQDLAGSLSERETRDELGIGSIRDAIADRLFPGTSTIQTRARYFLFLPWIFQELEQRAKGGSRERSDRAERDLIRALRQSNDTQGLIGGTTAAVQRLPSSVYWNGLAVLGIRRVHQPLSAYYRWLDDPRRASRVGADDDGTAIEGVVRTWWDRLPPAPAQFPDSATFALTGAESQYLSGRAIGATPQHPTMLGFLFEAGRADARAAFPWEHPQRSAMPDSVRDDVDVAKHFSLFHYGAALLFNYLIAEARDEPETADAYRAGLEKWQPEATTAMAHFDLHRVWQLSPRASSRAKRFIEAWVVEVKRADGSPIADDQRARRLVRSREIRVKGSTRSRIANPHRVLWNGASGSGRLDYRWGSSVQQIGLDVARGRARA
jgi:Family of unknown function (DUF6361)